MGAAGRKGSMVATQTIPERGDLAWLSFDPQTGHEQAGRRPAVVLSPSLYNGVVGLAMVCPVTQQVKGYRFEVALPEGLPVSGVVLADQARSVDWRARRAVVIGQLPARVTEEVLQKVRTLLS